MYKEEVSTLSAWNISKIQKNRYKLRSNSNNAFIEVHLSTNLKNDPEILLTNTRDMSNDYVVFYPASYPTDKNDSPIIGEAYMYDGLKCICKELVRADIIDTNIPNTAKGCIEILCL